MDRYDRNDDYRRDRYDRDNDRDGGYRSDRDRHPRNYDDEATDYPSSGRSRGGYRDNDDYDRDRSYRGRSYRDDDSYGDDYQGGRRRTRYDRDDDRGFFDRVGAWFDGDDDDDYRRSSRGRYGSGGGYGRDYDDDDDYYDERRSHRGRGPKNYNRSDDRIRDDVNDALTDDHYLDASDISVTAKSGEVTLDGHVYGRRAKRRAEDLAHKASGVSHVQNNLRVRDLDDVDDDEVKTYPDDPDATNRATTGSNTRKKAKS